MNIVPREGGNTFAGSFFIGATSEGLQGDNIDQKLRDRRIISSNEVKSNWDVNRALGGR